MAHHYRVLPWELDSAGLTDVLREAEALDLEEELQEIAYEHARRESKSAGKRGATTMPGDPGGYELESAEEEPTDDEVDTEG